MASLVQVRVTGILIEEDKILLVKQRVSDSRAWSLPGGRLEEGETIEEAVEREIMEETGLVVKVNKLLYLCEVPEAIPQLIHITFLMRRIGGEIILPTNEFDMNPITDVKMIPIHDLVEYGFTDEFKNRVENFFPESGSYMGRKKNIGL